MNALPSVRASTTYPIKTNVLAVARALEFPLAVKVENITMNTTIEKYGNRNWAVRIDGELLAVTVYKKGAKAIVEFLERMTTTKESSGDLALPKCGS